MAKETKKIKRVSDEDIILEEMVDPEVVLENEKLREALDKATIPIDLDPVDDVEGILFNGLEGRMLLVKVGLIGEPLDDERLERVEEDLSELIENFGINCLLYVTGPDVDIKVVG